MPRLARALVQVCVGAHPPHPPAPKKSLRFKISKGKVAGRRFVRCWVLELSSLIDYRPEWRSGRGKSGLAAGPRSDPRYARFLLHRPSSPRPIGDTRDASLSPV